jgi:hypothetical protein
MHFFDQIKTGGFAGPSTLQGAFLFAVNSGVMLFAFMFLASNSSWGVHPIARGRDFGFIYPLMKSRRVSQIEMGRRRRFKSLSHEN